jgi:hypothetical protein
MNESARPAHSDGFLIIRILLDGRQDMHRVTTPSTAQCMVRSITLSAVALAATASPAAGHVEASVDVNNRYLKLTPLGDRVRLAYTIYFGEVPGAALRRRMDTDGDGAISTAEADAFGREVAAGVQPAVGVTVDGVEQRWTWTSVDVGMGTPEVRAGSFAVDLIGRVCLAGRGEHELVVRDDYALPSPGETELFVDAGLGVKVVHQRIGGSPVLGPSVKFRGRGGPLAEGWTVRVAIGDAAPAAGDCAEAAPPADRPSRGWLLAGVIAVVAGVVTGILYGRWRRRKGR